MNCRLGSLLLVCILWTGCGAQLSLNTDSMRPQIPQPCPHTPTPLCDLLSTVSANDNDPIDNNLAVALCSLRKNMMDALVVGAARGWYQYNTPEWLLLQQVQTDYNQGYGYLIAYRSYVYANKPYYWANDYTTACPKWAAVANADTTALGNLLGTTPTQ